MSSSVDGALEIAAQIGSILEASNILVFGSAVGKKRPNLLADNGALEDNVMTARNLPGGRVETVGAESPRGPQGLGRMVRLNRCGVNPNAPDGAATAGNLRSLSELVVRVQSEELRGGGRLGNGDRQRGIALVADPDLLVNKASCNDAAV